MKWYLVVDDIGAALLLTVNFPTFAPGGPLKFLTPLSIAKALQEMIILYMIFS
jgi:hypothetical protein